MERLTRNLAEILDAERRGDTLLAASKAGELHGLLAWLRPESAALGRDIADALERNEIDDSALFQALRTLPEHPGPERQERGANVSGMLYGEDGQGHLVELHVDLVPGAGEVWSPQTMAPETRRAAEIAVAVGLGAEQRRWALRWQVLGAQSADIHIYGSSIGLPLAVAARAALLRRAVPPGWAFTGDLSLNGQVGAVGSLPGKLIAARRAGRERLALPAISASGLQAPEGATLVPLLSFDQLVPMLFPPGAPAARGAKWALAAGGLLALALGGLLWMRQPPPPPAPATPLTLTFDADGAPVRRLRPFLTGERFAMWITPPGPGELVVLHQDAVGAVEVLRPLDAETRAVPGGSALLVPYDAYVRLGWEIGGECGREEIFVFWSPGRLAMFPTLLALAKHPPEDAAGWARAFPDQPAPLVLTPTDDPATPTLSFARERDAPLVARVPYQTLSEDQIR